MTSVRSLRYSEAALGLFVGGLGVFIVVETAKLAVGPGLATIGPTLLPYLIGGGLVLIGGLVLREGLFGHVAHERGAFELDWLAVAYVSAGLILQMLLLDSIGWIPAATLLFMATARAFGSRQILVDLLLGLALTGLAFVLFNYGLGLDLPLGSFVDEWLGEEEV